MGHIKFNQLSCGVQHNLRWRGAEKTPSALTKRPLWKKFKKHYLKSNEKLASTQTMVSKLFGQNSKTSKHKNESDLFKIIDNIIDGFSYVNKERVRFSINF